MSDINIKQGDTRPALNATLIGADGSPQNLTGVNLYVQIEDYGSGELVNKSSAKKTDPQAGKVRYEWSKEDTSEPGYYRVSFLAIYGESGSNPDYQHFPNEDGLTLEVNRR